MVSAVVLDTGPLGRIAHPRPNREVALWVERLLISGTDIFLPEIADYELRRNLLLEGLTRSVRRLDQLKAALTYVPLTTETMLKAAELWADARRRGVPTADPKELDGDAILAAQAIQVGAVVATDNVGHLSRFVDARNWMEIS
ncbi:MAG: PIN domain-containing protein [Chloroflexi bacterium]|nr:PIN domain-containing protein [Chloroflexota bacterium]